MCVRILFELEDTVDYRVDLVSIKKAIHVLKPIEHECQNTGVVDDNDDTYCFRGPMSIPLRRAALPRSNPSSSEVGPP